MMNLRYGWLLLLLAWASSAGAQSKPHASYDATLMHKRIAQAQMLLEKIPVDDEDRVLLALNQRGTMKVVPVMLVRKEVEKIDCMKRKMKVTQYENEDPASPFGIRLQAANGVNSNFAVEHAPDYFPLAIKYPVRRLDGEGKRHVVYTPYDEALETPEMINAGLEYLKRQTQEALADLERLQTRSEAFPGYTIPQLMNEGNLTSLISILAIIEHMDHTPYYEWRKNSRGCPASTGKFKNDTQLFKVMEKQVRQVLVVYGANQAASYSYSLSRAQAGGPMQIWPRSLRRLQEIYPSAQLNSNIFTDHLNSFKAAILHLDMELIGLGSRVRSEVFSAKPQMDLYGILAAGYNSNAANIGKRLNSSNPATWQTAIPKETRIYLKKTAFVRRWLKQHDHFPALAKAF